MSKLNILVVGGHPADVFDHCGGTIAHHTRRGDSVTSVVMTHGLRKHDAVIDDELRLRGEELDPDELGTRMIEREELKQNELIDACRILGVEDVRFLKHDDSVVMIKSSLVKELAAIIREIRPHLVITHFPFEVGGVNAHFHHGNTGKLTLYAISSAAHVSPVDPRPPHRVAQLFFMAPAPATFVDSYLASQSHAFCNFYVDITDVIELKVRAWNCLRSQRYGGDYARKAAETWNGKDGFHMRVGYAEGFIANWPEIGTYLPVSKERLERANESETTMHERTDRLIAPFVDLS